MHGTLNIQSWKTGLDSAARKPWLKFLEKEGVRQRQRDEKKKAKLFWWFGRDVILNSWQEILKALAAQNL